MPNRCRSSVGSRGAHHGAQAADESARGAADVFLVVKVSPGANVRFRHGPTGAVADGDAVELGGIVSLVAVAHVEDVLFEDGLLAVGSGFGLRDVEGDGLGELGLDGGEDPFLELREEAPRLGVLGLELARLGAGDAGGLLEEIFREHAAIVRDVVHGEPGADGRARGRGIRFARRVRSRGGKETQLCVEGAVGAARRRCVGRDERGGRTSTWSAPLPNSSSH